VFGLRGGHVLGSTGLLAWAYGWNIAMRIEIEQEADGRWLTEIPELPGVMVYGASREDAVARVKALALRVLADRLEHGETIPELLEVFSVAA
jgi:predicted RNase H-like HicB family nuclease